MINKIFATQVNGYVQKASKSIINRKILKPAIGTMAILAGASMSNMGEPKLVPTEMVIPNGLDFREKFYYNLKGKLPPSVYERWFPKTDGITIDANDEIVTVNTDGRYIGSIIEGPHEALIGDADISDAFTSGDDIVTGSGEDISELVSPDTEAAMSAFEIFKHLAGLQ